MAGSRAVDGIRSRVSFVAWAYATFRTESQRTSTGIPYMVPRPMKHVKRRGTHSFKSHMSDRGGRKRFERHRPATGDFGPKCRSALHLLTGISFAPQSPDSWPRLSATRGTVRPRLLSSGSRARLCGVRCRSTDLARPDPLVDFSRVFDFA